MDKITDEYTASLVGRFIRCIRNYPNMGFEEGSTHAITSAWWVDQRETVIYFSIEKTGEQAWSLSYPFVLLKREIDFTDILSPSAKLVPDKNARGYLK